MDSLWFEIVQINKWKTPRRKRLNCCIKSICIERIQIQKTFSFVSRNSIGKICFQQYRDKLLFYKKSWRMIFEFLLRMVWSMYTNVSLSMLLWICISKIFYFAASTIVPVISYSVSKSIEPLRLSLFGSR